MAGHRPYTEQEKQYAATLYMETMLDELKKRPEDASQRNAQQLRTLAVYTLKIARGFFQTAYPPEEEPMPVPPGTAVKGAH